MPPKLKLKKKNVADTTAGKEPGQVNQCRIPLIGGLTSHFQADSQSPQVTAELKNQFLEAVNHLRIQKDELEIDPNSELVRAGFSEVRNATLVRNGERISVAVKMFRLEGDNAERMRLETVRIQYLVSI